MSGLDVHLEVAPLPEAERRDIVVIGAGLVGLCSAMWLQMAGHKVTLVDREPPLPGNAWQQACSFGNACTVAPQSIIPVATPGIARQVPGMLADPLGPLAIVWRYLPQLAPWLRAFLAVSSKAEVERISAVLAGLLGQADAAWRPLVRQAGAGHLEQRKGVLYLYKSEKEKLGAETFNRLRERHGVRLERIDASTIRELEPKLAPHYHSGTLYNDAYTFSNPRALAQALALDIVGRGGRFVSGQAALKPLADGVEIRVAEQTVKADHVVIAAGAWSAQLARQIGDRILLETERGYHVLFPDAGELLGRPVCYTAHGFYMTPMADGLRAAGTVELGGLKVKPNHARADAIARAVETLLPGAGHAGSRWMGFRPSLPDSLPVIANSPRTDRVTYAFGHGHVGLTLAAITGRLVAGLIGRERAADLDAFRPDRFSWLGGRNDMTDRSR
ncbi:MAG: FAD-binding oxidoreductase [Proteobacteria bacterium]|nr:FAD-binding oxidoreductase [Pseudomonadota bacterium]